MLDQPNINPSDNSSWRKNWF